jgi:MarR family transcriptional regulator for hemolysin
MHMSYDRDQSAGYFVNLAGRLFIRALERRLAGSVGPMPVFLALSDGSSRSQAELARWAQVEQPTMANTLNRMERDGLIVRSPDPADGRSMLIALSPIGLERAIRTLSTAFELNGVALAGLSEDEKDALFDTLRRVIANLEADLASPA